MGTRTTPSSEASSDDPVRGTLTRIEEKFSYDLPQLERFLDTVFHGLSETDGQVLTWVAKGPRPGYPQSESALFDRLKVSPASRRLYFGTATCHKDPDGKLYNRKARFGALCVVVLDDVGTKVDPDTLPEALRHPSYIIETSPGNFQYGFVLVAPIRVLEQAQALVSLVYESGYTDSGGALATKLVRLPDGVNGKDNSQWRVKLHSLTDKQFTPDELLKAVNSDLSWAQIETDTQKAMRERLRVDTSRWSAMKPTTANLEGVVDPVLEWLYEREMVVSETNEWMTIQCPWHTHHTSGDGTAGYSPLGRGDSKYETMRGFYCFHDHCSDKNSASFLEWVAEQGGPEVSVSDHAGKLLAEWVYDAPGDQVWSVKTGHCLKMPAFRNLYPHKTLVYLADGSTKMVAETALWLTSPLRVTVMGSTMDPSTHSRIVAAGDGTLRLNVFDPPAWGEGEIVAAHVDRFVAFLTYLIPADTERAFFLQWLANKASNMAFRGPAMLMVAKAQGTGRTTLADMVRTLFGAQNVATLPFDRIVVPGEFNEWLEAPFVQSDETLHVSQSTSIHKAYEALKDTVDFRPKAVRINAKYQVPRISLSCSSFLLFSNHEMAIGLAHDDRRLYVITNPDTPASPDYFTDLNNWLNTDWAPSVWRWLITQRNDDVNMYAPVEMTEGKRTMLNASGGDLGVCIDLILDLWRGRFIWHGIVKELVDTQAVRLGLDGRGLNRMVQYRLRERTVAMHQNVKVSIRGKGQVRPRMLRPDTATRAQFAGDNIGAEDRDIVRAEIEQNDMHKLKLKLEQKLTEEEL